MSKIEIVCEAKIACALTTILMPSGLLCVLSPELLIGRLRLDVFAVMACLILLMVLAGGRLLVGPRPRDAIMAATVGIVSFTFCNAIVSWETALFPGLHAIAAVVLLVLLRRDEIATEDRV